MPHFAWKSGLELGQDGRYVVEAQLGDGTFGRVLACRDRKLQRRVAVKVVKGVRRFCEHAEAEVEVLAEILRRDVNRDGRCVDMFDAFLHDSLNFCIVFEPLDTSLRDFLKANDNRGFAMVDIREIARQLLQSIAFLHSIGIVHTDLKCRNVMLRDGSFDVVPHPREGGEATTRRLRNCDIVVIDFGSACFPHERHSGRVGTRQFRAPEVLLGLTWDESSDLWSAGCIVSMLYLGQRPFSVHEDMEHLAMMEKVLGVPLPPQLLLETRRAGSTPAGVAFDLEGRLLWPSGAVDLDAVERVAELPALRRQILGHHTPFYGLCAGLLDLDPKLRFSAAAASASEFFVGCALPE